VGTAAVGTAAVGTAAVGNETNVGNAVTTVVYIDDIVRVACERPPVRVEPGATERIRRSRAVVERRNRPRGILGGRRIDGDRAATLSVRVLANL
jgi:hypothetical protein